MIFLVKTTTYEYTNNYASREGIKWVVLTNGIKWEIHRVTLDNKVQNETLFIFDFATINPRQADHQDLLFLLCKRGVQKDPIDDCYEYRQSVNRYTVGVLLLTESIRMNTNQSFQRTCSTLHT